MSTRDFLFYFGLLLFLEGILIQTDFSQYGIQSIFIGGLWLHHWFIGLVLIGISRLIK